MKFFLKIIGLGAMPTCLPVLVLLAGWTLSGWIYWSLDRERKIDTQPPNHTSITRKTRNSAAAVEVVYRT